ncbi:SIS domain-containing protein [Rhizobium johnstonii]|uniref:SIS domain-containing protein n=1 Tax=Rhizobium TaxID=379 RepID=UPI0010315F50|nr:SIS domain-containing protein [Rhizobium leguminosarum]TBF70823.1 SIS domain-containing protein [Rhizobium leguminosarum]TBG93308.1 SIS domain-containing protein [Rhizobium leguminosarum]TBG98710.1 SIS domain-containing protein [Rhizobium leguminosarum]TBH29923.1 SIS domain-containing protein [Rhizobium leguminosarum]TBH50153.1 SIS domain-containing protein [Rhizobium leguminosarum]
MTQSYATPLLAPGSPLDARSRTLIQALYEKETSRLKALPVDDALNPVRRRRVEVTRTEIAGQPDCLVMTLTTQTQAIAETVARLHRNRPKRIYLTGCGDSLAVMIAARPLLERMFSVACEPVQALDMAYYFNRPVDRETLVIGLSSSGETPRTVEAMIMAKALGAETLMLSNTEGSTLMREADHSLFIHAERKGWPTQASTAALGLLISLALAFGESTGRDKGEILDLRAGLDAVPGQIAQAISGHESAIENIAQSEVARGIYLFAGGGPAFACAFFGAAKVKECTPDHAIAIPVEEYHHYHSQKHGDPLFLIAPDGFSVPRARDTAEEGQRVGGRIFSIVSEKNDLLDDLSQRVIRLPCMPEMLAPLVYSLPVQLFAYHLAMAKFAAA